MPNYCNNTLQITGSNKDLNNFWIKNKMISEDLENEDYDIWGNIDDMIEEYIKEYKQL